MQVKSLHIYPIKSFRGLDVSSVELDKFGPRGDRRLMLVDHNGKFITQRQVARLALLQVEWVQPFSVLTLKVPGSFSIKLDLEEAKQHVPRTIQVWDSVVQSSPVSKEADQRLSEFLNMECQLVAMAPDYERRMDGGYGERNVGFADGFPWLLISQESLDLLNSKLATPVPMNRFRPNIVVEGAGVPHAEDTWRRIRIGSVELAVVKPCTRCVITTTDQITAERFKEPLATLATYRRHGKGITFGQNLNQLVSAGTIRVGDTVEIIA